MPLFVLIVLFILTGMSPAYADYVVWQDPKTGVKLTYPDTWRTVSNQLPGDVVTILGPSPDDRPMCRLRTTRDGRFTVYPAVAAPDVQRVAITRDFWIDYTGRYNDVTLHDTRDDAGLGRAFAGMATASFTEGSAGKLQARTGFMLAGIYHDTTYVLDCSARRGAYTRWYPDFIGIAKSVDMASILQATPAGTYDHYFLKPNKNLRPVQAFETTGPLNP